MSRNKLGNIDSLEACFHVMIITYCIRPRGRHLSMWSCFSSKYFNYHFNSINIQSVKPAEETPLVFPGDWCMFSHFHGMLAVWFNSTTLISSRKLCSVKLWLSQKKHMSTHCISPSSYLYSHHLLINPPFFAFGPYILYPHTCKEDKPRMISYGLLCVYPLRSDSTTLILSSQRCESSDKHHRLESWFSDV